MTENGDVADFKPTAKLANPRPEGTRMIFVLSSSFVLHFPTRNSTGTPTRDLEFGREVAFCFGSALLGNFARAVLLLVGYIAPHEPPGPRRAHQTRLLTPPIARAAHE